MHVVQTLDFDQIQVQVQFARLTAENMRAFLLAEDRRIAALLSVRDQPIPRKAVVLLHPEAELTPDAEVRGLQAEWMKANAAMLRLTVHAVGLVLPNPVWRGAFTAITWLFRGKLPLRAVAHGSLEQALAWGLGEVANIGGTVSQELLDDGVRAIERRRAELAARFGRAGA